MLVVIRALFSKLVRLMGWQHHSPSMVFSDAIMLSDYYPALEARWELKDRSSQSFPGDHASVLLIWGLFMGMFSRSVGQFLIVWGLTLLFMMPRLVAGAHWGSDALVGGVFLSLLGLAWACFTPFAYQASEWLEKVTRPLTLQLARLPLLGRLSIISGR